MSKPNEHICPKDKMWCPVCDIPTSTAAPATQHRVIPVEWHRVAVEPGDNAPARVERERVCAKCEKWVYYDNGDVTFHCGCNAHWKWRDVPAAQPATDDRTTDTIPATVTAEVVWVSQDYAKAVIVKNQELRTRIEVLEAALREIAKGDITGGRAVLVARAALAAPSGRKEERK